MKKIIDIANRIKGIRQILEIQPQEMAEVCGVSVQDYLKTEKGESDFSFTFLYKCAQKFGVDITELISGETPKLSRYFIVRKDKGLPIDRRKGFAYQHLGYLLKNRPSEPFKVLAHFNSEEQDKPVQLSNHEGFEFDYILKGSLKIQIEDHTEILSEGDSIYYDSSLGHGMIASGGKDCEFLAIVMKKQEQKL
ncbi:MAG: XRE family transcriptional regulator [Clostridia bacterium]|nr:XRE family transcriptional regulator [Clostridia bacterium]